MTTGINRMSLMASQHDMERGLDPSTPIKAQNGVVCIQHRTLEEHAGDNEELKAIVMAQKGKEKKVLRTKKGKCVVCFNPSVRGRTTTTSSTVAWGQTQRSGRTSWR